MRCMQRLIGTVLLAVAVSGISATGVQATESNLRIAQARYRVAVAFLASNPKAPTAYREANDAYKQLKAEIQLRKEEIAAAFRAEIAAAKAAFDQLKESGLTQAQKNGAAIARDAAIADAAARRETALQALRPEPVAPQKPGQSKQQAQHTKAPKPQRQS